MGLIIGIKKPPDDFPGLMDLPNNVLHPVAVPEPVNVTILPVFLNLTALFLYALNCSIFNVSMVFSFYAVRKQLFHGILYLINLK